MWDKKIIAISEKDEVAGDFLQHIEKLANAKIDALILRQRELSEFEYLDLAKEVIALCKKKNLTCILHGFDKVALKLDHRFFHCPLGILSKEPRLVKYFHLIGTSIHSEEEYFLAERFKCNYAIAGHIFQSSCKEDIMPRGIGFLEKILKQAKMPIYAIGGIRLENLCFLKDLNIEGVCMRSELMKDRNLKKYVQECKQILNP
ncbi:thiamine phosphate synthase [Campylobacter sp. MIT 99-7217]|uniref:thiamine phosphate synthase n=1 Tax=Campylobacter sp. MIT 99-7217 TaxID=535091 RepID=UPI0011596DD3|nr:thiamine phosphate synthase [Campylobacter sp. MIT 99-7217]TQR29569.1 thiamine phosphate synthase [Campylobacter sp. MIT 99-7217]